MKTMLNHPITIRQIEVFVALADLERTKEAAEALAISQPAVSMSIAALEEQAGELFDHQRGRLVLNARGRERLPQAREILLRASDFLVPEDDSPLSGRLRIGTSNTVGNYYVGDLLGDFIQTNGAVDLQVDVQSTQTIVDRLLAHDLDVGCVEGVVQEPELEQITWREDSLVLCSSPSHPLAKRSHCSADDFEGVDWILRERGSATRRQNEALISLIARGRVLFELGQTEGILQAVISGLGVALLPEIAVKRAVASGQLAVLPTEFTPWKRKLSILLPRTSYHGRVLDAFIASLKLPTA